MDKLPSTTTSSENVRFPLMVSGMNESLNLPAESYKISTSGADVTELPSPKFATIKLMVSTKSCTVLVSVNWGYSGILRVPREHGLHYPDKGIISIIDLYL